jgi:hypothetical protein
MHDVIAYSIWPMQPLFEILMSLRLESQMHVNYIIQAMAFLIHYVCFLRHRKLKNFFLIDTLIIRKLADTIN